MRGERRELKAGVEGALPQTPLVDNPLGKIDPRKILRAREILGTLSDVEAIEVALDLLVLDDAYASDRRTLGGEF